MKQSPLPDLLVQGPRLFVIHRTARDISSSSQNPLFFDAYCSLITATSTSCCLTICNSKEKATLTLCIFSCNVFVLSFLSFSHIPTISGDIPEIFRTPQSKYNISVRFDIFGSYGNIVGPEQLLDMLEW